MPLGTLYIVGTPIGNLEDVSARALGILREVDLIACEDTRHSRTLLARYGISTRRMSYYGAKEKGKARELTGYLEEGKDIALISDAGMPGIADPGALIVKEAVERGARIVPIPGPSALIAALAASGLPSNRFVFEGFLPRGAGRW
ncbi:MAG: 16S rRNA (cytidine(1402)-2'-O)-methyltransferase [Candidatus Aureabacteria bacterium]|nr:16S rRNA (cytidine(1402)-2'-O)-methyltransferase [Candidatus Auribacterota bacterium]